MTSGRLIDEGMVPFGTTELMNLFSTLLLLIATAYCNFLGSFIFLTEAFAINIKGALLTAISATLFFRLPFICVFSSSTTGIFSIFCCWLDGTNFMISDLRMLLLKTVASYASLLASVILYSIA